MTINQIENRRVKVSAHSITVKNENGKTCGIVHADRLVDCPMRIIRDHWKTLRQAGLWGTPEYHNVVLYENKLYLLYSTWVEDFLEKYPNRTLTALDLDSRYEKRQEQIVNAQNAGIEVISCLVLK